MEVSMGGNFLPEVSMGGNSQRQGHSQTPEKVSMNKGKKFLRPSTETLGA
jgi:hypothetical protein